jgi:hypothetical protein
MGEGYKRSGASEARGSGTGERQRGENPDRGRPARWRR